jgi:hypothetical protein
LLKDEFALRGVMNFELTSAGNVTAFPAFVIAGIDD